jgi:peptide/nickel transport system permease protein
MLRYALRRLLIAIPAILIVAAFTFSLIHLAPGDPAQALLPIDAQTPEALAAVRREWNLDTPLPVQFGTWLGNVAQGDFGRSITTRRPVGSLIADRLPVTLELAAVSLIISMVAGILLGVMSALHQRRHVDSGIRVASLLGVSVPSFVWGILFVMLFGWFWRGILPPDGWVPITQSVSGNLSHLVLPAIALALAPAGLIARLCRSSMLDVLDLDYVRMAHVLGVPPRQIVWLDALKNALLPVVTTLGLVVTYLVGGAVVIETVFGIPGLGRLLTDALQTRDYPLVSGVVLVFSLTVMLVNLATDLLYAWVNPRIAQSYGGTA